ncbi:MAG: dihydropteroate synthase [Clostridia bacterium]|nr:dihydropteroate synthase [Clostridia bacterium]
MVFKAKNFVFDDTKTHVMGILNLTPDSFSDGGRFSSTQSAIDMALKMVAEGADIIDVGGQSTRPGSSIITAEEEWARIEPVLKILCKEKDFAVSVDTFYPEVAKKALDLGVDIINDVSGNFNEEMAALVTSSGCGWIIMHSSALDDTCIAGQINSFFADAAKKAAEYGILKEQLCFDAGIGFNKTNEQCFSIIKNTAEVRYKDYFYLLGASRKRCIGAALQGIPANERDIGTSAANTIAIMGGANIIRVHCVKTAIDTARVADAIRRV